MQGRIELEGERLGRGHLELARVELESDLEAARCVGVGHDVGTRLVAVAWKKWCLLWRGPTMQPAVTEPFSEATQRDLPAWVAVRAELRRVERARQIRLADAGDAE